MNRDAVSKWCERGIAGLVLCILLFSILMIGAVQTQDFLVVQALTVGVLLLWLVRLWALEKPRIFWPPICWPALAFTLYAVVRYVIVRPLTHLRDVSDDISRGKTELRAELQTGDEFQDLADSFNP